jgi:hypothetical protein
MNSVELIGIVRQVNIDESSKQYLVLEVNRPYLDKNQALLNDYFKVYRWGILDYGVFNNIIVGSQVAIRGHLINKEDETIILSEYVKVLYYPKSIKI